MLYLRAHTIEDPVMGSRLASGYDLVRLVHQRVSQRPACQAIVQHDIKAKWRVTVEQVTAMRREAREVE